jgi:hypothetical protein
VISTGQRNARAATAVALRTAETTGGNGTGRLTKTEWPRKTQTGVISFSFQAGVAVGFPFRLIRSFPVARTVFGRVALIG